MLQPLVQRNERVLDSLGELDLVRHLPGLEGPAEVQKQIGLNQWDSGGKERLLERAHRLKDPGS